MKPFLIALAVILFCRQGFSQFHYFFSDSSTNPARLIAALHIKRDSIFSYTMDGKKMIDSSFLAAEEYNADGTINTQLQVLSAKKELIVVDSFFYNDGGLLVRQTQGSKGGQPYAINTMNYDSKGLDTGGRCYMSPSIRDPRNYTSKKEYNKAGRLVRKYLQCDDKKKYLAVDYAYDDEGRLIEMNYYKENGELSDGTLYEYKNNNQRKTAYRKKPDGKTKNMVYYYDRQGRCTRISWFLSKEPWEYRFRYNPDGTLFEYQTVKGKKQETHRHYYSKG